MSEKWNNKQLAAALNEKLEPFIHTRMDERAVARIKATCAAFLNEATRAGHIDDPPIYTGITAAAWQVDFPHEYGWVRDDAELVCDGWEPAVDPNYGNRSIALRFLPINPRWV